MKPPTFAPAKSRFYCQSKHFARTFFQNAAPQAGTARRLHSTVIGAFPNSAASEAASPRHLTPPWEGVKLINLCCISQNHGDKHQAPPSPPSPSYFHTLLIYLTLISLSNQHYLFLISLSNRHLFSTVRNSEVSSKLPLINTYQPKLQTKQMQPRAAKSHYQPKTPNPQAQQHLKTNHKTLNSKPTKNNKNHKNQQTTYNPPKTYKNPPINIQNPRKPNKTNLLFEVFNFPSFGCLDQHCRFCHLPHEPPRWRIRKSRFGKKGGLVECFGDGKHFFKIGLYFSNAFLTVFIGFRWFSLHFS